MVRIMFQNGRPPTTAQPSNKEKKRPNIKGRAQNLNNLKAAVLKADWFDTEINPKLADFCLHYGLNVNRMEQVQMHTCLASLRALRHARALVTVGVAKPDRLVAPLN
jgi:hypothetical protein